MAPHQQTSSAWVIQRPSDGAYRRDVLRLDTVPLPSLSEGEVLVRTLYISLDPSNLMWLKLQPGWMEDVAVGDVMKGPSLGVVEHSRAPGFAPGDLVIGPLEWRDRSTIDAALLENRGADDSRPLDTHLTIFSHVGRAAMIGLRHVARIRAGDTVLVSAAAGATGSLACQIALAEGCRVIAIAGGEEKCEWLRTEVGVHAVIDYKSEDVAQALQRLSPEGPDVYFDNVGGEMLDSVLPLLAERGRVAICGQISQYGATDPRDAHRYRNIFSIFMRRLRVEGFVVPDFWPEMEIVDRELQALYDSGSLHARTHLLPHLDDAAVGLEMLEQGTNHGKLIVQVSGL